MEKSCAVNGESVSAFRCFFRGNKSGCWLQDKDPTGSVKRRVTPGPMLAATGRTSTQKTNWIAMARFSGDQSMT